MTQIPTKFTKFLRERFLLENEIANEIIHSVYFRNEPSLPFWMSS